MQPIRHAPLVLASSLIIGLAGSAGGQILAFDPAVDVTVTSTPDETAVGDWDGDGDLDLAVTADGPDRIELFFNAGDGTFPTSTSVLLATGSSPEGIFAANVDTDTDVDLVVTLKALDFVQLVLNDGTGAFSVGAAYTVGVSPEHVVAARFDGDSSMDLAVCNRAGNSVAVLLNDGTGNYGAPLFYAAGNNPRELDAADLDEDGDVDIAVAAHDNQEVRLFLNDGSGIFSAGPTLPVTSIELEGLEAEDLDNDGDNDLAVAGNGSGREFMSIFLQDPAGVFNGPNNHDTNGVDSGSVFAADLDLDADMDVVVACESSNDIAVFANNGDGTFAKPVNLGTDTLPDHVTGADLDGNGAVDLVTTNDAGDSVSLLLNQNQSAFRDLGFALAGTNGPPFLEGIGTLKPDTPAALRVRFGLANATAFLIIGLDRLDAPFAGGTLVPTPDFIIPVQLDGNGELFLQDNWPAGVTPGDDFFFQVWILDPSGPRNFSATNAIEATAQ